MAAPLDKTLAYRVPAALVSAARVGLRVRVPLGRRQATGYLLEVREGEGESLKEVAEILDREPLFSQELAAFYLRAADYYLYPPGEAVRTALPAGLSGRGADVAVLRERVYFPLEQEGQPSGGRQREILDYVRLQGRATLTDIRGQFPSPYAPLARLVDLGFVKESEEEKVRDPFLAAPVPADVPVEPSPDQAEALCAIENALEYSSGMTFEEFVEDRKTIDAVIRNFITIGEAASHLPEDFTEMHPDFPGARCEICVIL